MAVSQAFSGTQSVSTTEFSLTASSTGVAANTTAGVFQTFLDLNDMVSGDELQVRIYEKARAGDTQRIIYQSNLIGPLSPPTWVSPALMLMNGWDITVLTISGGTITVLWSIRAA
jgi:hypothetical protein